MVPTNRMTAMLIVTGLICLADAKLSDKQFSKVKDLIRKSIVFDKKTPDVFYCPIQRPTAMNKLIVRSRPLHKLCEYEGRSLPLEYKSDCYDDVDESNYGCKEKYRIMKRFANDEFESPTNT